MDKYCKILCLTAGITSLVFAMATGIVMIAKGQEVSLWITLVVCITIFIVASITCAVIETKKQKELPEKINTTQVLLDAYKEIFK